MAANPVSRFDPKLLLDPGMFPWPVDKARLIETHISWVYLAGDRVVKLKRPVELGFVDFRDSDRRKQACVDEVRLNQRLTTDVYLGVVPVTANGVDAPGEPIEWAVLMRRLPADRMLDRLLLEGSAPDDLAARLADRLIPFHALPSSRPEPAGGVEGPLAAMRHAPEPETGVRWNERFLRFGRNDEPSSSRPEPAGGVEGPLAAMRHAPEPETESRWNKRFLDSARNDEPSSSRPEPAGGVEGPLDAMRHAPEPETESRWNKRFLHFGRNDEPSSSRPEPAGGVEGPLDAMRHAPEPETGVRWNERFLDSARNDELTSSRPEPASGVEGPLVDRGSAPNGTQGVEPREIPRQARDDDDVAGCPTDPNTYLKVLTDNLDQVAECASDILGARQLALVDRSMRSFMTRRRDALHARFDAWLSEGHGDLRCEHICLEPDAMQIYDCVEFEIAIRCADVASDLAFLLMDLRRLGAGEVGDELLARYRTAGFDLPQPVVDLYAAHRALVRCKVAALERSGRDAETGRAFAFEAASYLDIATSFACPTPPMLVLVSGLSGSGKSTVAAAIARAANGVVLSSDEARKELAGLQPTDSAASEWHRGIYTSEWTARTYDRLLEMARAVLAGGQTAVVDATFLDNAQRERFVALCGEEDACGALAAARRSLDVARDDDGALAAARRSLDVARDDDGALAAARRSLDVARDDDGALAAARRSLDFARDDDGALAAARRSLDVARDDDGALAAARRSLDFARDDDGALAAARRSLDFARDDEGERDDGRGRCPVVVVWTELDDATARTRIEQRARERQTASDATFEIRERQIAELAERPVRVPDSAIGVTVDTGGDSPPSLDPFFAALETAGLIGSLPGEMRHA